MTVTSVAELLALYERWGHDAYDEDVSQLAHALQTAALAGQSGASAPLVAAALVHDVGHLLRLEAGERAPLATAAGARHEVTGSRYLGRLFPAAVTGPVALHVRAKRYRCAVDPDYHGRLSAGSQRSLQRQGGPMPGSELASFEANPGFRDAVLLREWDDCGKQEGIEVPPLLEYSRLLERVATQ